MEAGAPELRRCVLGAPLTPVWFRERAQRYHERRHRASRPRAAPLGPALLPACALASRRVSPRKGA